MKKQSKSVDTAPVFAKSPAIRVMPETAAAIKRLAIKHDRYSYQIIDGAIKYFEKYGFDPCDLATPGSFSDEIKKLRDTFISFQRTHEKKQRDFWNPLTSKMDSSIDLLADTVKAIPKLAAAVTEQAEKAPKKKDATYLDLIVSDEALGLSPQRKQESPIEKKIREDREAYEAREAKSK